MRRSAIGAGVGVVAMLQASGAIAHAMPSIRYVVIKATQGQGQANFDFLISSLAICGGPSLPGDKKDPNPQGPCHGVFANRTRQLPDCCNGPEI